VIAVSEDASHKRSSGIERTRHASMTRPLGTRLYQDTHRTTQGRKPISNNGFSNELIIRSDLLINLGIA
jgi:thiamine pyrophosphate-dependent acetolactate synthase large subunit-like protein